jgi:PDZ domain-containing protein
MRAVEAGRYRAERERPARGPGIAVWVVVALVMLAAAGYLYHPPLAVLSPQDAIDVTDDVSISGVPVDELDGRYLVTPVRVSRPNALGALFAAFDPSQEVVSLSALAPVGTGQDDVAEQQREAFVESEQLAAAAAASAAGLEVRIEGSGAAIVDVIDGSPADGVLEPGDVIVAVDGEPVSVASDLGPPVSSNPPGTTVALEVERGATTRSVRLSTQRIEVGGETFVGLGVLVETRGLFVDLPFEIEFRDRPSVGGPSAGLVFALLISDLLDPADLAAGRDVAATGSIAADGDVGAVGGVPVKLESAERAGADLFLVPAGSVGGLDPEGVTVRGVGDLEEALDSLRDSA